MTLGDKQAKFSELLIDLLAYCRYCQYDIKLGELYRPPEMAEIYAKEGKGICNSLHTLSLAVDINIKRDGEFLTDINIYRPIGEWWKKKSTNDFQLCWGGDFKRIDVFHFSLEHEGIQ